jgi:hypothetical protein
MRKGVWVSIVALALAAVVGVSAGLLNASDHDDGEADLKGRALNITDLFIFREKDQNPGASDGDLVMIMNVNPRSLPRQQCAFSTSAVYGLHVSRVANNDATPTGAANANLRFETNDYLNALNSVGPGLRGRGAGRQEAGGRHCRPDRRRGKEDAHGRGER